MLAYEGAEVETPLRREPMTRPRWARLLMCHDRRFVWLWKLRMAHVTFITGQVVQKSSGLWFTCQEPNPAALLNFQVSRGPSRGTSARPGRPCAPHAAKAARGCAVDTPLSWLGRAVSEGRPRPGTGRLGALSQVLSLARVSTLARSPQGTSTKGAALGAALGVALEQWQ